MAERYRLTPDEAVGAVQEVIQTNFFELDLRQQEDVNRGRTPDQRMMTFVRYGESLFVGRSVSELEQLIKDIKDSPLSRRIGGNRLMGFLEGYTTMLRMAPRMRLEEIIRLSR